MSRLMKVSIITVSYNSSATIGDTLRCIADQDYPSIEHIIIDGGSTDSTMEIVKKYSHVEKYLSEKDKGLYDAMNKGLALATGDFIGILNSDDVYSNANVISKVVTLFKESGESALYGDLQYVKATDLNAITRYWKSGSFKRSNFYYGWMPPHPTFFVKKEVYDKVGLFNTSLRSAADYEMMLRILVKYNYRAAYLPEVLVKMRGGGVSNASFRHRMKANLEDRKSWAINGLSPHFFTLYLKPIRKIFQFIRK